MYLPTHFVRLENTHTCFFRKSPRWLVRLVGASCVISLGTPRTLHFTSPTCAAADSQDLVLSQMSLLWIQAIAWMSGFDSFIFQLFLCYYPFILHILWKNCKTCWGKFLHNITILFCFEGNDSGSNIDNSFLCDQMNESISLIWNELLLGPMWCVTF